MKKQDLVFVVLAGLFSLSGPSQKSDKDYLYELSVGAFKLASSRTVVAYGHIYNYEFGKAERFLKDAMWANIRLCGVLMQDISVDEDLSPDVRYELGKKLLIEYNLNKKVLQNIGEIEADSTQTTE